MTAQEQQAATETALMQAVENFLIASEVIGHSNSQMAAAICELVYNVSCDAIILQVEEDQ